MKNPRKKDWITTVKNDIKELGLELSLEDIENMPKASFKKMIKSKIKESAFLYLSDKKIKRNGKGIEIVHSKLEMQSYLQSEDQEIINAKRKLIFQLTTKINFKVISHFKRMHTTTVCDGCKIEESTTKHTLECQSLLGKNEIVTYLPQYIDLYGTDEKEQAYISRIFKDNVKRLPEIFVDT